MEEMTIEARTIDEAIEKACEAFGAPREKLNIEIVAAGSSGFLGLGAKKAQIRASRLSLDMDLETVFSFLDSPGAPPQGLSAGHPSRADHSAERPAATGAAAPGPAASRDEGDDCPAAAGPVRDRDAGNERPAAVVPAPPRDAANGRPAPAAPLLPRSAASERAAVDAPRAATKPATAEEPSPSVPPARLETPPEGEPTAAKARRILEGILTRMEIPSRVEVEENDEAIILNIEGDGSGLLIGKRGQNLDALQYIVNKAVHHTADGHKMIIIDTEEYRKRREESLVALALRLGEKAQKTKKPVTVGHMNAHDRRVIHMAMQDSETLTTKSRGEGEYRKIVILPSRRGTDSSAA